MHHRPKVLVVNKLYPPWTGGVERAAELMIRSLRTEFDFQVLVCAPKGPTVRETWEGVPVVRVGSLGMARSMPVSSRFPAWYHRLSRKTDLVHFHEPFPLGTWSGLRYGFPRALVSYHCDVHRQKILNLVYRPILLRFLNRVDLIAVGTAQLARQSRILRCFAEKIRPLPYGLDDEPFSGAIDRTDEIRRIRSSAGNRTVFLAVGRLVPYKGFHRLIQAMSYCPEIYLILVGEGPQQSELRRLAQSLGLLNRIRFQGFLSEQDLPAYYRAADAFVLPSVTAAEAFGLVQLEAMASGLPVINTALPTGAPHVGVHGQTGFTVPPGNATALAAAMNMLAGNPDMRRKMGAQARKRFERHYHLERMAQELRTLYHELLKRNPGWNTRFRQEDPGGISRVPTAP